MGRLANRIAILLLLCRLPSLVQSGASEGSQEFPKPLHQQLPQIPTEVSEQIANVITRYWKNDWSGFPPELTENIKKLRVSQNNSTCSDGWRRLFSTSSTSPLGMNISLGVQALDAFGKPGAGLLGGNFIALGAYDECVDIERIQYCFVNMYAIPKGGSTGMIALLGLKVGMCLPEECTEETIIESVTVINEVLEYFNITVNVYTEPSLMLCESEKKLPYNAGAAVMIAVCALLAVFVAIGTGIDWVLSIVDFLFEDRPSELVHVNPDVEKNPGEQSPLLSRARNLSTRRTSQNKSTALKAITAFSFFETVPTILSTKQPPSAITCVHGMRVLSICWVILCHSQMWGYQESGLSNPLYVFTEVGPRFSFQAIANGFFSVDSFFFLSGLLVAYLTLRTMNKKDGRFPVLMYYIHRYLRLTPTYAFVLFFYWFLSMHLTDGPSYHYSTGTASMPYKSCEKYWWTNLLYINNFYPNALKDECMGWSWYLANDMQFYVISPLFIVLFYYSSIAGLLSVGIVLVGSFVATGTIVGYYDFAVTIAGMGDQSHGAVFTDEIYVKPYARIAPYLVGIVLGYLLYKKVNSPLKKLYNWVLVYIPLWAIAIILGITTVYGLYDSWHGHTLSTADNVIYAMLSRFTWGVALAIVVFACHNGYGWVVNSFLSMKFWIPLSRLSFNAYLVHEIVLTVVFGNLRNPVYYTDITMAVYSVGVIVISFGAAGVVTACVEFPIGTLESIVFKVIGFSSRESTRNYKNTRNGDRGDITQKQ